MFFFFSGIFFDLFLGVYLKQFIYILLWFLLRCIVIFFVFGGILIRLSFMSKIVVGFFEVQFSVWDIVYVKKMNVRFCGCKWGEVWGKVSGLRNCFIDDRVFSFWKFLQELWGQCVQLYCFCRVGWIFLNICGDRIRLINMEVFKIIFGELFFQGSGVFVCFLGFRLQGDFNLVINGFGKVQVFVLYFRRLEFSIILVIEWRVGGGGRVVICLFSSERCLLWGFSRFGEEVVIIIIFRRFCYVVWSVYRRGRLRRGYLSFRFLVFSL